MQSKSKIAVASILTNAALFAFLYIRQVNEAAGLQADAQGLARSWGLYFLWFVGGSIVLNIAITMFLTGQDRAQGGRGFDEVTDERDRYLELKALRVFALLLSAGFLTGMLLLAIGQGLETAFRTWAWTALLSGIGLNVTYVLGYERGL